MAGAGGGAWKVAYADFVTAMMAFFLVMWITGQSQEVKEAVSGYFQDPWGTSSSNTGSSFRGEKGSGDGPPAALLPGVLPPTTASLDDPADEKTKDTPNSRWAQDRRVHLLDDSAGELPAVALRFPEASAELSPDAVKTLHRVLSALAGKPNLIEIRAHSSPRPLPADSPFKDHWRLCFVRSEVTMQFLIQNGIEAKRIRLSQSSSNEPLSTRMAIAGQDGSNYVEVFMLRDVVSSWPEGEHPPAAQRGTRGIGEARPPVRDANAH